MKYRFKFGVKQIIMLIVTAVLIAVMVAGNIVLQANSITIHKWFGGDKYIDGGESYEMGDALVAQLIEDSAVMLRNEEKNGKKALPLDKTNAKENRVNLFGWNATRNGFLLTGTGSGGAPVLKDYQKNQVTLSEAFTEAGHPYNESLYNEYAKQSSDSINVVGVQNTEGVMKRIHNPGASFYTAERMQQAREYSDVAIVVFSRNTGENCGTNETINNDNYSNGSWLELTANEKIMMENVQSYFSDGKIIVLINSSNVMETDFLETYGVDAAFFIGPVGQSGARAIPHLLYGEKTQKVKDDKGNVVKDENGNDKEETVQVSPSGRTADTFANFNYTANGKAYTSSWSSTLSNGSALYYQEGIYNGYKWYETADAEGFFDDVVIGEKTGYDAIVQYPFGFGLSYTDFEWSVDWPSAKLVETVYDENTGKYTAGEYEVKVAVTNKGEYAGKDVVELYCHPEYKEGGIEKAERNLVAFAKTATLEPGQTQILTLKFTSYDLASYDDYDKNGNGFKGYELEKGNYELMLMRDAHNSASDKMKKAADSNHVMTCDGVLFENDPVTGTKVENQFTGDNAYANQPIDGSKAYSSKIEYLSRAGGFANYPKTTSFQCKASKSPDRDFETDAWDNEDVSNFQYGQDAGMYLITNEDGSKASASDLKSSTFKGKPNIELMETLGDYDAPEWDEFLNQLTKSDINNLICYGKFQTVQIESVGKPFCNEYDGPSGFNQNSSGTDSNPSWVVFPAETILGCSWNTEANYNWGKAMGLIARETGVHGWYGPGLNLHRSPYYGRNYEYFSEDGTLTGKLVAQAVKGAKEQNLVAYMKHFVVADCGQNSGNWWTWLTEQSLRENYLRAFELAVKEGGANAIMSGFSCVGSVWAGSNYALSTQILRNEWGFRGTMITDWENGYMNKVRGIKAGNNLWLGQNLISFNFNDPAEAYAARLSAKNILYTYVDCYNATENKDVVVGQAAHSALFSGLWVTANVLLVLGMVTCIFFFLFSPKQFISLFQSKKAVAEGEGVAEGQEPVEEAQPEVTEQAAPEVESAPETKAEEVPEAQAEAAPEAKEEEKPQTEAKKPSRKKKTEE